MDFYLSKENVVERLLNEWKLYGKIIIAYDYDETVFDFHKNGRTYEDVCNLLRRCEKVGAYFIVFTCCGPDQYKEIREDLTSKNLPFDRINDNMDFIDFTGRKVFYNILLDDRAGLESAFEDLQTVVKIMEG